MRHIAVIAWGPTYSPPREVYMWFIHLIWSNLIGLNLQPWYNYSYSIIIIIYIIILYSSPLLCQVPHPNSYLIYSFQQIAIAIADDTWMSRMLFWWVYYIQSIAVYSCPLYSFSFRLLLLVLTQKSSQLCYAWLLKFFNHLLCNCSNLL